MKIKRSKKLLVCSQDDKIVKINEAVMNFEILEVVRVDCITPPNK